MHFHISLNPLRRGVKLVGEPVAGWRQCIVCPARVVTPLLLTPMEHDTLHERRILSIPRLPATPEAMCCGADARAGNMYRGHELQACSGSSLRVLIPVEIPSVRVVYRRAVQACTTSSCSCPSEKIDWRRATGSE
jgi:hypothetical protein